MIAFTNGAVEPVEKQKNNKIHRLCMIMDKEDNTVFTEAMELHYIGMKAFARAINKANCININETQEDMFAYWLSLITEKEIVNKDIIENARKKKEEIQMAVSAIERQSEDKYARQAYLRRQDEIYFHNLELQETRKMLEEYKLIAQRAEQAETEIEELRKKLAKYETQGD